MFHFCHFIKQVKIGCTHTYAYVCIGCRQNGWIYIGQSWENKKVFCSPKFENTLKRFIFGPGYRTCVYQVHHLVTLISSHYIKYTLLYIYFAKKFLFLKYIIELQILFCVILSFNILCFIYIDKFNTSLCLRQLFYPVCY